MKKAISILLALLIVLSLCACGKTDDSSTAPADNEAVENENDNQTADNTVLALNQTYSIENFADLTLIKICTTDKLQAPSGGIYYQPTEEGNSYIDLIFEFTNTSATAINSNDIATLSGQGKSGTVYSSFTVAVESGSDISTYTSINPLEKVKLHCALSVPPSETDINVELKIKETKYTLSYALNTTISNAVEIKLNEKIEATDYADLTLKSVEYTDDILPSNTSGVYSHYPIDDANNTYLVAKFEVTNYQSAGKRCETFVSMTAEYMNKYKYTGSVMVEDSDGKGFSSYEDIEPLTTRTLVYKIEVPKTVSSNEVTLTITFNGNEYLFKYAA